MLVFGSLIYECERGSWKYTDLTSPPSWQYVRTEDDGVTEEVSSLSSFQFAPFPLAFSPSLTLPS
jgi:hypothetical protein